MRIVVAGAGRMGRAVAEAARAPGAGATEVELLDRAALEEGGTRLSARMEGADAVLDFTSGEQAPRTVEAAARAGVAIVVGTTGCDVGALGLERVAEAGRAAVHGPNFSLGVHAVLVLARRAAGLLERAGDFDVGIAETHHRHKRDHPSGTAMRLAEALVGELGEKERWAPGPPAGPADPATLWVTSARIGAVPGTHVVAFDGPHERIELTHAARDRAAFAHGALRAVAWTRGRTGVFTFEEVADALLGIRGGER